MSGGDTGEGSTRDIITPEQGLSNPEIFFIWMLALVMILIIIREIKKRRVGVA